MEPIIVSPRTTDDAWKDYQTTIKFNHQALLAELWKIS